MTILLYHSLCHFLHEKECTAKIDTHDMIENIGRNIQKVTPNRHLHSRIVHEAGYGTKLVNDLIDNCRVSFHGTKIAS